jgi:hypothetical protein
MASLIVTSLLAAGMLVTPPADEAYRADDYAPDMQLVQGRGVCERAIEQAIAMTGGELLSAHPARNGRPVCVLTVLVINAKGRPRKVRMRIPMDY